MTATVEVPKWVAPRGLEDHSLPLGTKVLVHQVMKEWDSEMAHLTQDVDLEDVETGTVFVMWMGWTTEKLHEPVEGIITGLRFPWSGRYIPGSHTPDTPWSREENSPGERKTDVVHRTYLVTTHIRRNPLRVSCNHLEVIL